MKWSWPVAAALVGTLPSPPSNPHPSELITTDPLSSLYAIVGLDEYRSITILGVDPNGKGLRVTMGVDMPSNMIERSNLGFDSAPCGKENSIAGAESMGRSGQIVSAKALLTNKVVAIAHITFEESNMVTGARLWSFYNMQLKHFRSYKILDLRSFHRK
jgi:hypothetical protein